MEIGIEVKEDVSDGRKGNKRNSLTAVTSKGCRKENFRRDMGKEKRGKRKE